MTTVIQTVSFEQVQHFRAERDEAWRLASDWEQAAEDAMRAMHDANVKIAELRDLVAEILGVLGAHGDRHVIGDGYMTGISGERLQQWRQRAGFGVPS